MRPPSIVLGGLLLCCAGAVSSAPAETIAVSLDALACPSHSVSLYIGQDVSAPSPDSGLAPQPVTLSVPGPASARRYWWCYVAPADVAGQPQRPVYADATYKLSAIAGQPRGEKGGAVIFLAPSWTTGRALAFSFNEGLGTDTLRFDVVNVATGEVVQNLKIGYLNTNCSGLQAYMPCGWDAYGGTPPPPYPPSNCGYRSDGGKHMVCQWVEGTVTITTLPDDRIRLTGRIHAFGTGYKGDPSRAVPSGVKTQIGSDLVWEGPRPAGVPASGYTGFGGLGAQVGPLMGVPGVVSVMNPMIDTNVAPPPPDSVCE